MGKQYNQWYWKLYRWFIQDAKYIHKTIYKGLTNLIRWAPIIYRDRNWDSSYIFILLEYKLKLQAKCIAQKNKFLDSQRDAEIIRTCVRLMEKVREDYYQMEYTDYHKTKYWFEDIEDKPDVFSWESEIESENFDDYFKKYPLIYKRVLNGEGVFNISRENESDIKQTIAMNIASINHNRARKLLFKIMEDNIERWWW
jgi:hypothetical protein